MTPRLKNQNSNTSKMSFMPTGFLRTWYERHFPINPFSPTPPGEPPPPDTEPLKILCLPYVRGLSGKLESVHSSRSQSGLQTKRTLKGRLGEHKQEVRRGDPKNGIAVHAHESNHAIDWDGAQVRRSVSGYWQRRATEANQIKRSRETMNLDGGLQLPTMWNPILDPP